MELYHENMKKTKHDYDARLYTKLMLNKLKVTRGELHSFVYY